MRQHDHSIARREDISKLMKRLHLLKQEHISVGEAVEEYHHDCSDLATTTQANHHMQLKPFVTWCETVGLTLGDMSPAVVRDYLAYLSKRTPPLKKSSIRQMGLATNAFLAWTQDPSRKGYHLYGDLVTPEVGKAKLPKATQEIIQVFSTEEIEKMLAACQDQPFPERDRAIILTLLNTGIRSTELCELTLSTVSLDANKSYIRVHGKGDKWRSVTLSDHTRIAIKRYLRVRHAQPGELTLFTSVRGVRLTTSGLQQIVTQLGKRAGIENKRVSPHSWRHTFAHRYLEQGIGDVFKLALLMGHESVSTTERYLRSYTSEQARQSKQSTLDGIRFL